MFPEQAILKDAMSSFSSGYVVYDGVAITAIDEFLNESSFVERMSPLHDHTVKWDSEMHRPWLDPSAPDPPAMLVLTNFAWNHPNQTIGIRFYRSLRSAELYEGVVNHPWFHPTAWEDIQADRMQISNMTRYYIFLDYETCNEKSYPRYGHGPMVNRDIEAGRGFEHNPKGRAVDVSNSKLIQASHVKLVLFDCSGFGPEAIFSKMREEQGPFNNRNLVFISISNTVMKAGPHDQGLPPPALRKFYLTEDEERNITTCNELSRPTLISFIGHVHRSQTRRDLYTLNNGSDIMVLKGGQAGQVTNEGVGRAFEILAKTSAFSAVGRGDNLFSYRLSEVMACGSIPVIYADDWLLPFGTDLINWTEAAVVIREADTLQTINILSRIPPEQRCRMRRKALDIYRKYIETGRGTVQGIIENFELSAAAESLQYTRSDSSTGAEQITESTESTKESALTLINDRTLKWNSEMQRLWLDVSAPDPPAMLMLTNLGWNHPNQTYGLHQYRSIRSTELYEGVVNHPWFHPTAWEEIQAGRMQISNVTRYYVFFDVETCRESNYPFLGNGTMGNRDTEGGRGVDHIDDEPPTVQLNLLNLPNVKGVLFDCGDNGPGKALRRVRLEGQTLAFISKSTRQFKMGPFDQGLPPPLYNKCILTEKEVNDIMTCNELSRPILLSFMGHLHASQTRQDLYTLRKETGFAIGELGELSSRTLFGTTDQSVTYQMLSKRSAFSATPRGESLFPDRFTEVVSCGSIPVVYADNWLLPFGKDLINWTDAAVLIPEAKTLDTVNILSHISTEERCRMRQKVYEIYRKYMETDRGVIQAIIENFELAAAEESRQLETVERSLRLEREREFAKMMNESALSLINDRTVKWDSDVDRMWLDPISPDPPAMLILTNLGWNHPNQTYGTQFFRGIRSAELYEGIVNHPWFHPTAWQDIETGRMLISNLTRYYVFLDFETCAEAHYPRYGYGKMVNRDKKGDRGFEGANTYLIADLAYAKVFQALHAKLVLFDCSGNGPERFYNKLRYGRGPFTDRNLIFISISTTITKAGPYDQGLPPPALRKFYLTEDEERNIKSCNESSRPTLISFTGHIHRSQTRRDLYTLRNESGVLILKNGETNQVTREGAGAALEILAKTSAFSAVGRGDNLFSYRLSEVMACGSIPVIYADDWLLPFGNPLINWTEAAVVIREADTLQTIRILSQIPAEQRCRMRQNALEIYRKYIETGRGTVQGIIENFELSAHTNYQRIGTPTTW